MVRLANAKYTVVPLTAKATIFSEEDGGKTQQWPVGSLVLTNVATGKVTVQSPAAYAASFETVAGVVRPKSPPFTFITLTAQATVTTSDGRVQRGAPGDALVTNTTTGEIRLVKPADFATMFE